MLDKPEIQAETTSLWKRVDARAVQTDADGQGVWLSLSERLDLSKQKPLASKDVEEKSSTSCTIQQPERIFS